MTTPQMTLSRAQTAFLRIYDRARMPRDSGDDLEGAPCAISLRAAVDYALWHGPESIERRAILFAKALQKARARIR
jgi:hypothetical protein